jgi:uncharacterized protein YlzI (FlbEa/FlbD family)
MGNKSFESVAEFRDVGTTLINGNSFCEENKEQGVLATIRSVV